MAIDVKPTTWIANYSLSGANIVIPIASLTGLTADDANATTGDIRKINKAFLQTLYAYWITKTTAELPTKMKLSKTVIAEPDPSVCVTSYLTNFTETLTSTIQSE